MRMKLILKTIPILCFFISFGIHARVLVTSSTARRLDLKVSLPAFKFYDEKYRDGNTYSCMSIPNAGTLEIGNPDVPGFGSWILVPNGTKVQISVNTGKPVIYKNVSLPPVQTPQVASADAPKPDFVKNLAVYSKNADYPGTFAQVVSITKRRGQSCTVLWIYPYQYNPVRKTLSVYPDLKVSVSFAGNIKPIPQNLRNERTEKLLRNFAINADEVLSAEKIFPNIEPKTRSLNGGCEFLIISHDDFEDAANTLANRRNNMGISTTVTLTSQIGDGNPDTAEIEAYIENAYNTWNPAPSYLLLIGDKEFIPTFYCRDCFRDECERDASDWKYADIEDDYTPDIAYGRLPVDTEEEAINAVLRIVNTYEHMSCYTDYFKNAVALSVFQDRNDDGYADARSAKTSEDVRNYLLNLLNSVQRIYSTEQGQSPAPNPRYWSNIWRYTFENDSSGAPIPAELRKPGFPWDGDALDIIHAVEDESEFLLIYNGHGACNEWCDPWFPGWVVDKLSNATKAFVIWSLSCQTGNFDNSQEECFAEHWLEHPYGASGIIAATYNIYLDFTPRFTWGLMDAIWTDFIEYNGGTYGNSDPFFRMGDVINEGKMYMKSKFSPDGNISLYAKREIRRYHWLGDPTMEIFPQDQYFDDTYSDPFPIVRAAPNSITSSNCLIEDGSNVSFAAGNYVLLKPGVHAQEGSEFLAYIDPDLQTRTSLPQGVSLSSDILEHGKSEKSKEETSSEEIKEPIPTVFSCAQNKPNPFMRNTTIKYGLPRSSDVNLTVFNIAGQAVKTLVNANQSAGFKSVNWDGSNNAGTQVSQGIYFYVFRAGEFEEHKKMILLK